MQLAAQSPVQRSAAPPSSGSETLEVMRAGQRTPLPAEGFEAQAAALAPDGPLDRSRQLQKKPDPKGGPSQAEVGDRINTTMNEMNSGVHNVGYRRGNSAQPHGGGANAFFQQPDKSSRFKWTLHPATSASEGLLAWLAGPTVCECRSAVIAAQYKAILDVCGAARFDQMFGKADGSAAEYGQLVIAPMLGDTSLRFVTKDTVAGQTKDVGKAGARPGVEVGDKYYFANHRGYAFKHPDGLWNGENAIFAGTDPKTGEQLWTGLGASRVTESKMLHELRAGYDSERTSSDYAKILQRFGIGVGSDAYRNYLLNIGNILSADGGAAYVFDQELAEGWQAAADKAKEEGRAAPKDRTPLARKSPHPWKLASDDEVLAGGGGFTASDSWKIDAAKLRR